MSDRPRRLGAALAAALVAAAALFAGVALLAAPAAGARAVSAAKSTPNSAATGTLDCGNSIRICIAPAAPRLTQSHCPASGTKPLRPRLTMRHTRGVVYTADPVGPYEAGQLVRVIATAQTGYVFTKTVIPDWRRAKKTEEILRVVFAGAPTCVETQAPVFTNDLCRNSAPTTSRYQIADTPGVVYYVDSLLTAPGSYPAVDGSTITVAAHPVAGITLVGVISWRYTFATTPSCVGVVQAVPPTFSAIGCRASGQYTLALTRGVAYRVNGAAMGAGTYRAAAGSTVTVVAVPRPGHTLQGTTSWSHTFATARGCVATTTASQQQVVSSGSGGLRTAAPGGPVLADTGSRTGALTGLGLALVGLGALCAMAGRRRDTDRGGVAG